MSKKTPPVDIRRVIRAAAEAALEEPAADAKPKKRRLSTGRALLLGAGLVTAGRVLVGGRGSAVIGSLQERLGDLGVPLATENEDDPELAEEEEFEEDEPAGEEAEEFEEDEPAGEEAEDDSNGSAPEPKPRLQRRGRM